MTSVNMATVQTFMQVELQELLGNTELLSLLNAVKGALDGSAPPLTLAHQQQFLSHCYCTGQYQLGHKYCELFKKHYPDSMIPRYMEVTFDYAIGKDMDSILTKYTKLFEKDPSTRKNGAIGFFINQSKNLNPAQKDKLKQLLMEAGNSATLREFLLEDFLQAGRFEEAEVELEKWSKHLKHQKPETQKNLSEIRAALDFYKTTPSKVQSIVVNGQALQVYLDGSCSDTDLTNTMDPEREQEELTLIRRFVPESGVYVDVGANIGIHTMFYSTAMKAKRVIAVEANPVTLKNLHKNLELNADILGDIQVEAVAVSRKEGEVAFCTGGNSAGNCISWGATDAIMMPAYPLDDLIQEKVDFIKIDVEGEEMNVILGAAELLMKQRPIVFVECWPRHKNRMLGLMQAFEYKVVANLAQDLMFVPMERL